MLRSFLAFGLATLAQAAPALMPLPSKIVPGSGQLAISNGFRIENAGVVDPRLTAAIARTLARLSRQTGIPFIGTAADAAVLRVECASKGNDYPTLGEDETYTLDVTPRGAILKSATVAGSLHGLETFLQLVEPGAEGFGAASVHIEDRPRFPWRGLMLDVSRHWMPIEVVKRNLDAMAAVKLNVFHWHLSEDQGFRVESKRFPKLHELGSDGLFYTQDQIREIVAYARDRGIRVVPEFDIPGHTTSWLAAYPELGTNPGKVEIWRRWGVSENALDPSREETYQFLDEFFGEITALFPDPYWHIGGDEVVAKQWNASARVQAFAKEHNLKDADAIQAYFNQRVQKLLQKRGKILVGWDEVLHPDLPKDIVVQSWRGQKSLAEAAAKGYRGILSWGFYLDHLRPASYHYEVDPMAGDAHSLPADAQARILGGEACVWTEYMTAETVDSRIWPRAAAIAERFWSPPESSNQASMYDRMERVSRQLEFTGVQHRANYAPMLDRMAGGKAPESLRVLADAVEGLGLSQRARSRQYTSLVPMNRLADAARPESESVHALEVAARKVIADPKAGVAEVADLRAKFTRWAANDAQFQAAMGDNPLLTELKSVSKDLSTVGATGLRLLDYLEKGQKAPAAYVSAQTAELARMQRPNAELSLAAVRPVKLLLDAVR
ncbi:MAG TPA: family 20 glycosylhydrolase [Candidatus Acidoferrum sp.]|nr:family 20 glycosylhydrolase [Candidatus Acidoferrum sp.]